MTPAPKLTAIKKAAKALAQPLRCRMAAGQVRRRATACAWRSAGKSRRLLARLTITGLSLIGRQAFQNHAHPVAWIWECQFGQVSSCGSKLVS